MRYLFTPVAVLAMLLVLLLTSAILRADPAATPSITQATPAATQGSCDVYLTPFTPIGNDSSLDWVGKAVQQNLLTDLARANYHPLASDKPISTTADAQTAAKTAGAKYLISGSYQVADQQVRFTGQLIDSSNGNVLGGISTTGAMRDLFKMEDALSSQAVQQLGQHAAPVAAGNVPVKPAAPVNQPVNQPANTPAPPLVVQIVQAPGAVAAPTRYQGSALEQYVNTNRSPSSDYTTSTSVLDSNPGDNFASTPGQNYNVGISNGFGYTGYGLGGFGLGYGYGYGLNVGYPLPPYGRNGYGTEATHRRHLETDH